MKNNFKISLIFFLLLCFGINAQEIDPKLTEVWSPVPEKVSPGDKNNAPSDAIILFDGRNLDEWVDKDGNVPKWAITEGVLTVEPKSGQITTKKSFGDCQLHIEWRSPVSDDGKGQGKGNSGVFFMGQYEIQVLDSYDNPTYSNGQAGSVYKQHIPLVNASRKPGEWQTYDIIFTAPVFNPDSTLASPAYFTVIHNGVLIQNHVEVKGITVFRGEPYYKYHAPKLPISLQDHGDLVSYRNIWIREL